MAVSALFCTPLEYLYYIIGGRVCQAFFKISF
nr:MAG TPA: hypothetical protein [Caudoviricetes sp.]